MSYDPLAWHTLTDVLGYRSFLNNQFLPALPPLRPYKQAETGYEIHESFFLGGDVSKNVTTFPAIALAGYAPPQDSARSEHLSEPQHTASGAQFIIIDWRNADIKIALDDQYFKNVIIRNAHIDYHGGPTRLENVYFVNCTFSFNIPTPKSPTSDFVLKALDNTAVSFTHS